VLKAKLTIAATAMNDENTSARGQERLESDAATD
jgi:hypothetical protein